MKPDEIKVGHVYRSKSGMRRTITDVNTKGMYPEYAREFDVKYTDHTQDFGVWLGMKQFVRWAVADITLEEKA